MKTKKHFSRQLVSAAEQKVKEREFWLKQLGGEEIVGGFCSDVSGAAPGAQESVSFSLAGDSFSRLMKLSNNSDYTLHIILAAGLMALLYKYTGKQQQDIMITTPIYKQEKAGHFINTILVLKQNLQETITFKDLLVRVKQGIVTGTEHQGYPIEVLMDRLNLSLPEAAIVVENIHDPSYLGDSFPAATFSFLRSEQDLKGTLRCDQGLFKSSFVKSLASWFTRLLETILIRVDIPLSDIKIFTGIEREQLPESTYVLNKAGRETLSAPGIGKIENINALLAKEREPFSLTAAARKAGSNRQVPGPAEMERLIAHFACLARDRFFAGSTSGPGAKPEIIDLQVETFGGLPDTPRTLLPLRPTDDCKEKTAVIRDDPFTFITYGQLQENARQLAGRIQSNGGGSGSPIGLMFEPSIAMVEAAAAVSATGATCLSLDPAANSIAVAQQLDQADAPLLLTDSTAAGRHRFTILQSLDTLTVNLHKTAPRPQINPLEQLPFPDRSLVNQNEYNKYIGSPLARNYIPIQATRGCPYKCAYCHKIWPKTHVFRPAEHIFQEVKMLYDMGVKRFIFIDDIFNLNIKNSTRFFQLLIKNNMAVQLLFPNGLRGDILTGDYIDLMVEAGTVMTNLALETASPRLQKLVTKNLDLERFRENTRYLCRTYPQVILELSTMHGFPTETEAEAMMTLDFIKSLHWVHFPYVFLLKVYPNTDMEKLALEQGISKEDIIRTTNLAFHEMGETLPFNKSFTLKYQTDLLNNYFLSRDRLLSVLPHQMKLLTVDEILPKYNAYLAADFHTVEELLQFLGVTKEELGIEPLKEDIMWIPDLDEKLKAHFGPQKHEKGAFRILLLDVSQAFTSEGDRLNDMIESPLGFMYLLTYLKQNLGDKVHGKIAKSRIDFDNFAELRTLVEEFRPNLVGVRTLTFYRDFYHKTIDLLRQWGFAGPIITGGPYSTSDLGAALKDLNIALAVVGEGEITFSELMKKILDNGGKLPDEEELKKIPGLAFIPGEEKAKARQEQPLRQVLLLDTLHQTPSQSNKTLPGTAVSFIFDSTPEPVIEALDQGDTLYIVPKTLQVPGIHTIRFSSRDTGTAPAAPLHLRVKVTMAAHTGSPPA